MLAPDTVMRGLRIAIIDFETTGKDPLTCEPVQVAVVHLTLGSGEAPVVAYSSLIRPNGHIPQEAAAIHGITDEMVADAPTMAEVGRDLAAACEGRVVGAFNVPYDWPILKRCVEAAGLVAPKMTPLDPLVWNRRMTNSWKGKLNEICARLGVSLDNAHDASADALATAMVIEPMLKTMARRMFPNTDGDGLDMPAEAVFSATTKWALGIEADMERFFTGKGQPFTRSWSNLLPVRE
jgi:ATP-dependent DNA helicase DinG